MTFEKTTDLDLVRSILVDPACYHRMCNDSAPSPENFEPAVRDRLVYVLAKEHSRTVGLFVMVLNLATVEVHFCIVPEAWGRSRTGKIGRAFVQWVWDETSIDHLVGPVPEYNRLALGLAKDCGFTEFGREIGAVMKDGRQYDRILLHINRRTDAILR